MNGTERHWNVEICDDWADMLTVSYVMDDIQRDGRRFYCIDNGQSMVLYYLDAATVAELNRLSSGAFKPVIPK